MGKNSKDTVKKQIVYAQSYTDICFPQPATKLLKNNEDYKIEVFLDFFLLFLLFYYR